MKLHQNLLDNVRESYVITIMRRMMMRISEQVALKERALAIITGESIGQVASQTLESMNTINDVTSFPVIRPLATYDKQEIIEISKTIDCYDISIRPFSDCCTVYVPKSPAIHPRGYIAARYEKYVDMSLIQEVVDNTMTFVIDRESNLDLSLHGFTVKEAFEDINNTKK
jgi:thiamine biosynthesis protein ThiI